METKVFKVGMLVCLVLVLICATGQGRRDKPNDKTQSSPFDFLKKLRGSRKGNHSKEIHQLKSYLETFGYLQNLNKTPNHAANDHFDETLESAIKTYQHNYHIPPTGILDAATISKMIAPRCGVADIINGTNYMQPHPNKSHQHQHGSIRIHSVSHYSFFSGRQSWPASRTRLRYGFMRYTPAEAVPPIKSALQKWASVSQFSFSRGRRSVDLLIGFQWRDHSDGYPFDGPGGVLAHAFAPTDGRMHLDGEEMWSIGAVPDYIDLESVALHEIGHLLGLGHSNVEDAIMYPSIAAGTVKSDLHEDDVRGIRDLYNL